MADCLQSSGGGLRPVGPHWHRHRRLRRPSHRHQYHRPLPAAAGTEKAAHRHLRPYLAVHRRGAEIRRHHGRGPAGPGRDHLDRQSPLLFRSTWPNGTGWISKDCATRVIPLPFFEDKGGDYIDPADITSARHGQSVSRRQPGQPGLRPLHQQRHAGDGLAPGPPIRVHHPLPGSGGRSAISTWTATTAWSATAAIRPTGSRNAGGSSLMSTSIRRSTCRGRARKTRSRSSCRRHASTPGATSSSSI